MLSPRTIYREQDDPKGSYSTQQRFFVLFLLFWLVLPCEAAIVGYNATPPTTDDTGSYIVCSVVTAPASGTANPGTAWIYGSADTGTAAVYLAAYAYNVAGPYDQARVGLSSIITLTTTPGWQSAAITWTNITNATNYILCAWSSVDPNVNISYGSAGTGWYRHTTDATPVATFYAAGGDTGAWNNQGGFYVDFTESGGGAPRKRQAVIFQ